MIENINQPIKVIAFFEKGRIKPLKFYWQSSFFEIQKINLIHQNRLGRSILYHFSVTSGQTLYELQFNHQTLNWKLIKISDGTA